ncbi:pyridoxine 5'-phosphate oxidase C-terminal domain-containing protein [Streptomyces olivochromogenes]|uniref:pyridoxine 5'-phosphate oxidase C-terminal domain-containing protein n=1 Tax=Streptomyces olivochromogenes TaxID=1963 RepID=UPI0036BAD048
MARQRHGTQCASRTLRSSLPPTPTDLLRPGLLQVKDFDGCGLVFGRARGSRKGRELEVRPWTSLNCYWREALQQLTVAGPVEVLTPAESDRLFAARPPAAGAVSAVSAQTRSLADDPALCERARALLAGNEPLPRPARWTGNRLVPESTEFWYGPGRLHHRLRYDREQGQDRSWQ